MSMTLPTFASRQARMANCISAMPIRRCSTQRLAKATGGRLLLRIEDIDITRCTPEFEAGIFRDLDLARHRLGRAGAPPVGAFRANTRPLLDRLIGEELVYPAFMSRGEIRAHHRRQREAGRHWPRDPDGVPLYPAADKALSDGRAQAAHRRGAPFAWRLDIAGGAGAARQAPCLDGIHRRNAGRRRRPSRRGRRTGAT